MRGASFVPVAGRKPKPEGQAVTRHKSAIDWTEVPNVPFADPVPLPDLRPNGSPWSATTKRWWDTISTMPHCTLWSDSDWAFAEHTARLVAAFDDGDLRHATEIRNREKVLGTTADYRRDLRIRYVDPKAVVPTAVTSLDDYRDI